MRHRQGDDPQSQPPPLPFRCAMLPQAGDQSRTLPILRAARGRGQPQQKFCRQRPKRGESESPGGWPLGRGWIDTAYTGHSA